MKYMAALVAIVICFPCFADDMEQAVEDAKVAGIEAVAEAAKLDPAEFEVRIESNEEDENYYRRDQLVLSRWKDKPVFNLCKEGVIFGSVVIGKDYSPHINLKPNLEFSVNLITLEEGAWELTAYSIDPDFLEVFIVTSESVRLVSAEKYLEKLAEARGSQAAFKTLFDSLFKDIEAAETE